MGQECVSSYHPHIKLLLFCCYCYDWDYYLYYHCYHSYSYSSYLCHSLHIPCHALVEFSNFCLRFFVCALSSSPSTSSMLSWLADFKLSSVFSTQRMATAALTITSGGNMKITNECIFETESEKWISYSMKMNLIKDKHRNEQNEWMG